MSRLDDLNNERSATTHFNIIVYLCFRLDDLNNERSALSREQHQAMQQLHLQNQNLTISFKVRQI